MNKRGKEDKGKRDIIIIIIIIIISCVFQYKMVSQIHTITNNTLLNIGPVKGFTGYNPFLTITYNHVYIHIS